MVIFRGFQFIWLWFIASRAEKGPDHVNEQKYENCATIIWQYLWKYTLFAIFSTPLYERIFF